MLFRLNCALGPDFIDLGCGLIVCISNTLLVDVAAALLGTTLCIASVFTAVDFRVTPMRVGITALLLN